MNRRQIIQIGNALPPGVTAEQFALAQLASIVAWPVVAKWGVSAAATGFQDRLERGAVRMANGQTAVAGRFFDTSDGTGTGYSIQGVPMALVLPTFDTSGDFTVGVRFAPGALTIAGGTWGGFALGSYTSANNAWRLENDDSGRFRMGAPGGLQTNYADYAGPVVTASQMMYAVLRFFRASGKLNMRINGVYEQNLQNNALVAATFATELAFGLYWDFSTSTTKYRPTQLVKAVAANAALTGDDLTALENYLKSATVE
ncbi:MULTISPECIES: hypothetical protein [Paraburkholderia]|uniref:Uncharacterized protein n=1 Tax=Paraburkholderia guartelaensis TaxID=2546446 RepID=A0ABU9SEQ4_9BURK